MSTRTDIDLKALRAKLEGERADILRDINASADARAPVAPDVAIGRLSRMEAMADQAMALETDRRRHLELDRIDQALARMDDGDYGYCVSCDEEISGKRLQNDPAAPTCIDCAEKAEV
jgi:DnaK suppressor protein